MEGSIFSIRPAGCSEEVQYVTGEKIAEGSYSTVKVVYPVEKDKGHPILAAKITKFRDRNEIFYSELAFLGAVSDVPSVCKLYDWCEKDGSLIFLFELMWGSAHDLFKSVKRSGQSSVQKKLVWKVAQNCLGALVHLKGKNVIHSDIKPENIFFPSRDGEPVLGDFGIACYNDKISERIAMPYTPSYRPPEVFADALYMSFYSDVWALGITLLELRYGSEMNPPFISAYGSSGELFTCFKQAKILGLSPVQWLKELEDRGIKCPENIAKPFREQSEEEILSSFYSSEAESIKRIKSIPSLMKKARTEEDQRFLQLIQKMLQVNPSKRITPEKALATFF